MHPSASVRELPGVKKIIGIISGKGGVGKTFVSCNLALSLAKTGAKVGVIDADIYFPDVFKMFGVSAKLTVTSDNKIIPIEKWGLKLISMAGLCSSDDEPIAWRGPIISKITSQLLKESLWGELDFLIIDFPSSSGDIALTIMQNFKLDGVVIVITPQELSICDAKRAANLALDLKVPLLGIIENMRGETFGEGGGNRLCDLLQIPFLGSIPMRKQISSMCDKGTPPLQNMEEIDMLFSKISKTIRTF